MKFLITVVLVLFVLKNIMEVIFMATVFKFSLKKLMWVVLTTALILFCCTGCGGKKISGGEFDAVKTDVVFILGAGSNRSSNLIDTSFENYKVRGVLDIVAQQGGSVTFITNESEPQAKSTTIEAVSAAYSPAQQKKIIAERTGQIVAVAKSAKATSVETDLIQALRTASAYLANSDATQKMIFVFDNALMQTDGIIRFSDINFAQVENRQIVDYLEEERVFDGYLDLEGVQMQWMGFSATGGSQGEMTPEMTLRMEELWKDILAKAGADVCINSSVDIGGAAGKGQLPFVSAVHIPADNFNLLDAVQRIDEDKLLFLPDSTAFANPQAADDTLEPFVEFLNSNRDINVVVAGMTATQQDVRACRELSFRRAEKVRDVLAANGISKDRIVVVGLGCSPNDYRVEDIKADGTLDEMAAKQNRCILIADTGCDAGAELLKLGGELY